MGRILSAGHCLALLIIGPSALKLMTLGRSLASNPAKAEAFTGQIP
jgi:hypothetical protein